VVNRNVVNINVVNRNVVNINVAKRVPPHGREPEGRGYSTEQNHKVVDITYAQELNMDLAWTRTKLTIYHSTESGSGYVIPPAQKSI